MTTDTLPGLLLERAAATPGATALREKRFGIWQSLSWREYRDRVGTIARGLLELGLARGDHVAIVGDNRPEWILAELACQSIGAVPMGVYPDSVSEEVAMLVDASDARILIVEDQEQVDKALEVRERIGKVERVVYWDPRGLRRYEDPWLVSMSELASKGAARDGVSLQTSSPNDVALLATTSGTTGRPKLAMLTHENLISMAKNLLEVDPLDPGDDIVSFLPLAWVGEQMMAVSSALVAGLIVNFPEEPETASADMREIAPRVLFSPPRIWEGLVSQIEMKRQNASPLKKRVLDWALSNGGPFARAICLYWIEDTLGLRRLKRAYTGGAALGPDTLRFFHTLGVNLKQIYGQTEVSGISVVHRDENVRPETMGRPLPGTEIRISEDGEILTRSPSVFAGYYKNEEATRASLRDGWLHSGDAGYLDGDGHVVVIDRLSDVSRLPDGSVFSPQFVENKLKFSPYVREAVVFGGEGRPFVSAILTIDFENVSLWAETHRIGFTTFTDLSQRDAVLELARAEVVRVNETLPEAMRVRRFLLLHKELEADDAELTRTRKVRRRVIAERYAPLVAGLYGEGDAVAMKSEIAYQDGRRAMQSVRLSIVDLTRDG